MELFSMHDTYSITVYCKYCACCRSLQHFDSENRHRRPFAFEALLDVFQVDGSLVRLQTSPVNVLICAVGWWSLCSSLEELVPVPSGKSRVRSPAWMGWCCQKVGQYQSTSSDWNSKPAAICTASFEKLLTACCISSRVTFQRACLTGSLQDPSFQRKWVDVDVDQRILWPRQRQQQRTRRPLPWG